MYDNKKRIVNMYLVKMPIKLGTHLHHYFVMAIIITPICRYIYCNNEMIVVK